MIRYEELAAALEAYAARVHGRAPAGGGARPSPAAHHFDAPPAVDSPLDEPPTAAAGGVVHYDADVGNGDGLGAGEDHTQVGSMPSASADPSQEIDIGDVIDE